MNNAIEMCPSCGRYICDICLVNVLNVPHCKDCAEGIIYQMAATKTKMPNPQKLLPLSSTPSPKYYGFGYIGGGFMTIGALFLWILGIHRRFDFLPDYIWGLLWPMGVTLLCVGLAIAAIGFYGFYVNLGSTLGYICLVILPLGSLFFLAIFMYSFYIDYDVGRFSTGLAALSISLILMAITILSVRYHTSTPNLSKLTAIILFVAACLSWVVFITEAMGIGWFLLMVASILTSLVFFRAKYPNRIQSYLPFPFLSSRSKIRL
jgi:hypothetical protein